MKIHGAIALLCAVLALAIPPHVAATNASATVILAVGHPATGGRVVAVTGLDAPATAR